MLKKAKWWPVHNAAGIDFYQKGGKITLLNFVGWAGFFNPAH
jgi:hypothetical protein